MERGNKIESLEAKYYKVWGAHQVIDYILEKSHLEQRQLSSDEFILLRENSLIILDELPSFNGLQIEEDITIFKDDDPNKKIATDTEVYELEEFLNRFVDPLNMD